jgi:Flp pilus assembly protein TadD
MQPIRERIEASPDDHAAYKELAAALDRAGRPAEASETIHSMLRTSGPDPEAASLLEAYRKHALEVLQARSGKPISVPEYAP